MFRATINLTLFAVAFLISFTTHAQDLNSLYEMPNDSLYERISSEETWYFGYRTKEEAEFVDRTIDILDSYGKLTRCNGESLVLATAIQIKYNDTKELFDKIDKVGCSAYKAHYILGFASPRNLKFFKEIEIKIPKQNLYSFLYALEGEAHFKKLPSKEKAEWLTEILNITIKFISEKRTFSHTIEGHTDGIYHILNSLFHHLDSNRDFRLEGNLVKNIETLVKLYPKPDLMEIFLSTRLNESHVLGSSELFTLAKIFSKNGSSINIPNKYGNGDGCSKKSLTPYLTAVKFKDLRMIEVFEKVEKPKTSPFGTKGWTAYALAISTGDSAWAKKIGAKDPALPLSVCKYPVSEALADGLKRGLDISWISLLPESERPIQYAALSERIGYYLNELRGLSWSDSNHIKLDESIEKLAKTGVDLSSPFLKKLEKDNCSYLRVQVLLSAHKHSFNLNLANEENRSIYKKCLAKIVEGIQSFEEKDKRNLTELLIALSKIKGNEDLVKVAVESKTYYDRLLDRLVGAKTPKQKQAVYKSHLSGESVFPKYRKSKSEASSELLTFEFDKVALKLNSSRISDQEFKLLNLLEENAINSQGLSLIVQSILESQGKLVGKSPDQIQTFRDRLAKISKVKKLSDLKPSWEKEFKRDSGESLIYNRAATNVFSVAHGRMQCLSGTLVNSLSLALNPSLIKKVVPVAIFTSGHVLPGFLTLENGAWILHGIETTVEGEGKVLFGDTRSIKQDVVVVELREFLLSILFESRIENLKEFVSETKKRMETKYGIPSFKGTKDTSFAFGLPNTPSGDQAREKMDALNTESYQQAPSFLSASTKENGKIISPEGAIISEMSGGIDLETLIEGLRSFQGIGNKETLVGQMLTQTFMWAEQYGEEFLRSRTRMLSYYEAQYLFQPQATYYSYYQTNCEGQIPMSYDITSLEFYLVGSLSLAVDPVFGRVSMVCVVR